MQTSFGIAGLKVPQTACVSCFTGTERHGLLGEIEPKAGYTRKPF